MPSNSPVGAPVRILGVGARRARTACSAADIGAAWGRGGRGQIARVRARRGHPHPGLGRRDRGARRGRHRAAAVDAIFWGTEPPAVRRRTEPRVPRRRARACRHRVGGALLSGSTHAGIEALAAGADAIARRIRARRAGHRLRRAAARARHRIRGALRCGRGRARARAARRRRRRSARGSRTRARSSIATGATARSTTATSTTRRLFREEIFLPGLEAVVEQLARPTRSRVVAPRPRRPARRGRSRSRPAPTPARRPRSTRASATPAPRPRSSARSARSRRDGHRRASSAPAAAARPASLVARRSARCPARARSRRRSPAGGPRRYAEVLRARGQLVPGGETIPMGVPPESALFARGADEMLGLLGGRCVDCGTISTPPSIHPHCINCGGPKLEPVALARAAARCTPTS